MTQIIAGFASSDSSFAAGLARCFVDAAPRRGAVEALGRIPAELKCEAEHHAVDDTGIDRGFVDLRFVNEAEDFTLLVELKLHSGYGHEQLERYRSALEPLSGRAALVAVTTWLPSYGEDVVAEDPRWLGSARWAHAFDGMQQLKHTDGILRQLWGELLDLIREQGDFGVMDIDVAALEAWARWKQGRQQLISLLEEIYSPTLNLLRHELAERAGAPVHDGLAAEIRHKGKRLVWPWAESIHVEYAIPAEKGERLRVQFLGGHDELYFTVEARHENDRVLIGATDPLKSATNELEAAGFKTGHSWGAYWARVHEPGEWLPEEHATEALMRLVERDVRELVQSGIFEALAEMPDVAAGEVGVPEGAEDPDV
jgi:hypothetical protein